MAKGLGRYLATVAKGERREIPTTNLDKNWYNNILGKVNSEMMVSMNDKEEVEQIKCSDFSENWYREHD